MFDAIFIYGCTTLVCIQAMYGYTGAQAMGGPYYEWPYLAYLVGTLVPAIALGTFAIAVRIRVQAK